ncbi:hypothetical protein HK096_007005 [Nowakowskiella sp. JEL0078]|nr:hypothetical protein HK096_007005 [Nowakowskiella sp. JEL0078]
MFILSLSFSQYGLILLSSFITIMLSSLWFSPLLFIVPFAKALLAWKKEPTLTRRLAHFADSQVSDKRTEEDYRDMNKAIATEFLTHIIQAFGIAYALTKLKPVSAVEAVVDVWFFMAVFTLPTLLSVAVWEKSGFTLVAIRVLLLACMAIVQGVILYYVL